MKVEYKGYEIEVKRERCMGGWMLLYYSIFRLSDGYEVTSGFTEDQSSVKEYVGYMKERIDAELAIAPRYRWAKARPAAPMRKALSAAYIAGSNDNFQAMKGRFK